MRRKQAAARDRLQHVYDGNGPACAIDGFDFGPDAEEPLTKLSRALALASSLGLQHEAFTVFSKSLPSKSPLVWVIPALEFLGTKSGPQLCRNILRCVAQECKAGDIRVRTNIFVAISEWMAAMALHAEADGLKPHMLQLLHTISEELPLRTLILAEADVAAVHLPLMRACCLGQADGLAGALQVAGGATGIVTPLVASKAADDTALLFKLMCVLVSQPSVSRLSCVLDGTVESHIANAVAAQLKVVMGHAEAMLQVSGVRREVYTAAAMAAAQCLQWTSAFGRREVVVDIACHITDQPPACGQIARVALVRAHLAIASCEILTQSMKDGTTLLSGSLYVPLAAGIASSSIPVRLFALQTMESWLGKCQETVQWACEQIKEKRPALSQCGALHIGYVLRLVLSNWDHPQRRLSDLSADVFSCLLPVARQVAVYGETGAHDKGCRGVLTEERLMDLVLALPDDKPSKHAALLRLINPHATASLTVANLHDAVSARRILTAAPHLLDIIIDWLVISEETPAVSASLLQGMLLAARRELELSVGLAAGEAGGSSMMWTRASRPDKDTGPSVHSKGHSVKRRREKRTAVHEGRERVFEAARLAGLDRFLLSSAAIAARVLVVGSPSKVWLDAGYQADEVRKQVASAVASGRLSVELCEAVQDELLHAVVYSSWVSLWVPKTAVMLRHRKRDLRTRTLQYVCRSLVALDGHTARVMSHLCGEDAPLPVTSSDSEIGDDLSSLPERRLAARAALARIARAAGWPVFANERLSDPTRALLESAACITDETIRLCMSCPDPEIRVSVLEMVCVTQSTARVPDSHELMLVQEWLQDNICTPHVELRRRALRALDVLLGRCMGGLATTDRLAAMEEAGSRKERLAAGLACGEWLRAIGQACVDCLYPGAPNDRVTLPLELLERMVRLFGIEPPTSDKNEEMIGGRLAPTALSWALHPVLATAGVVTTLLNCCATSLERLKQCAMTILSRMPLGHALPGYEDTASVSGLVAWALQLTESPRDSESATGADIVRVVHERYALGLGWTFHVLTGKGSRPDGEVSQKDKDLASRHFLLQLLCVLRVRAHSLRRAINETFGLAKDLPFSNPTDSVSTSAGQAPAPLVHGIIAAIQAVLRGIDADAASFRSQSDESDCVLIDNVITFCFDRPLPSWRDIVVTCLRDISAAISIAMHIVAGTEESDSGSGLQDVEATAAAGDELALTTSGRVDCKPGGPSSQQLSLWAGPVSNSVNQLSADASFMGPVAGDGDGGYDGQDAVGDTMFTAMGDKAAAGTSSNADRAHMLVVAAWLATRESVKAIGFMITSLPIASEPSSATTDAWLLAHEDVQVSGNMLLNSLLRLKHVGSIFATADAFQLVCSHLLLGAQHQPILGDLPSQWLNGLLARLHASQQFILRRSAGFGAAFLALLRSEPRGYSPILLKRAMSGLLQVAVQPGTEAANAIKMDLQDIFASEGDGVSDTPNYDLSVDGAPTSWTWRMQVHALNILRLIFRDASLSEDTPFYGAAGIRAAVTGFSSPAWAVRNSSMMLFAAVADRAVAAPGRLRNNLSALTAMSNRGNGQPGITSTAQFFERYPALHPFVFSQLSAAVIAAEGVHAEETDGQTTTARVVFPLLLLLTRLQHDATHDGHHDARVFLPLFLRCSSSPNIFVRRLAGISMATAVPPSQALAVMKTILAKVIEEPGSLSPNEIHGASLQLSALCLVYGAATMDERHRDAASIDEVNKLLQGPFKSASQLVDNDLIRAEYLLIVSAWDRHVSNSLGIDTEAVRAANAFMSTETHDLSSSIGRPLLLDESSSLIAERVMRIILRKEDDAAGSAMKMLIDTLNHTEPSARWPACKAVKVAIKHPNTAAGISARSIGPRAILARLFECSQCGLQLCRVLFARLGVESHSDALRYLGHATSLLVAAGASAIDRLLALPDTRSALLRYHDSVAEPSARSHAIRLLGYVAKIAIAELSPELPPSVAILQLIHDVVRRITGAALDLRTQLMRIACGDAIAIANLLSPACLLPKNVHCPWDSRVAALCVPLLRTTSTLLQDMDDEVREAARAAVAAACDVGDRTAIELTGLYTRILESAPSALLPLLPRLRAGPCTDSVQLIDDSRAFVLLHALMYRAVRQDEAAAAASSGNVASVASSIIDILLSAIRKVLTYARSQLRSVVLATTLAESQENSPDDASAAAGYSTAMLSRPLFLENEENQYAQPFVVTGLAAGVYLSLLADLDEAVDAGLEGQARATWLARVLNGSRGSSSDQLADATALPGGASHWELMSSAAALTHAASTVEVMSLPLILDQGPWIPYSGADECPFGSVWAAARVAEALL